MGMMKTYRMKIEEMVWDAIECGAQTDQEIYAFIKMRDSKISFDMVADVTSDIEIDWKRQGDAYGDSMFVDPDWDSYEGMDVRSIAA